MRVLIIEDDTDLAESVKESISDYNVVTICHCGEDGLFSAKSEKYDVLIIDIALPDINGIEVCRMLRTSKITTPILMLTGQTGLTYKLSSFSSGADDYLTKPFDIKELEARIRALYKRAPNDVAEDKLIIGDLIVDTVNKIVTKRNNEIVLKKKEFQVLEYLVRHKEKVLTRELITENLWTEDKQCESNVVEVYIRNIRKKVDEPYGCCMIKTVYGIGYKISSF